MCSHERRSLGGERFELTAGAAARFGGDQKIAPVASEASAALIVLAPTATE